MRLVFDRARVDAASWRNRDPEMVTSLSFMRLVEFGGGDIRGKLKFTSRTGNSVDLARRRRISW